MPPFQNKALYLIWILCLSVSHWSEGLWWPGEAALCPPSPEVASDWSSVTPAGLWLAGIPLPHWSRSMVTPQYYQEFSCHSLSKHEAACFTNQIIIRPYKYLFSSSLPLSFSHKLTVYKLSCQNNFSDVQEIKTGKYISKLQFELLPA